MKSIFLTSTLILSLFLFVGCGNQLTSENLNKITVGMSESEVKTILGTPTEINTSGALGISGTTYHYKSGGKEVEVTFVNGNVIAKSGSF